jgi:hypothetical protein
MALTNSIVSWSTASSMVQSIDFSTSHVSANRDDIAPSAAAAMSGSSRGSAMRRRCSRRIESATISR